MKGESLMKRALKILGIVIAIILVILIALPFVVNMNSFRPRLESELTTALGREVKVGNLSLSIFSGSVGAEDLSIADDPAFSKDPFIRAKALNVGVELMPLIFSKTLHITDITLDTPQISLLRSATGKWNFSSLGGSSTAKPAENAAKPAPNTAKPAGDAGSANSATANLSVNELNVKNGSVSVNRANSSIKPHVYEKVNITVSNFSFTSQFPFTLSAGLPGGGDLKLNGKAGPINPTDASLTPLEAKIDVKRLDLAASGFVDPTSGIAGLADFDGTLGSNGSELRSSGTVKADKLKLSPKGLPAGRSVDVKYAVQHDMAKESGSLTQGDVSIGKALAQLTGTYQMQGPTTLVNMKLNAQGMPVDDLEPMLPALGVVLPSGSQLKGGTLSTTLAITGPTDKLVITGPVKLANTKLAGFDLGSKLSAVSKFTGGTNTGSDTSIQNLSMDARVAPEGIKTDNLNLTVPALGTILGNGTISPAGALNYKMNANLSGGMVGGAVSGLTQLAGIGGGGGGGGKSTGIPFFIQGTTSDPKFVPDVQGMLNSQLKGGLPNTKNPNVNNAVDALTGIFGKKKKPQ
jgi:AsmA protein